MNIDFDKLFNDNSINIIRKRMEKYLPYLFKQEESIEITEKILKIEADINLLNSSIVNKLFLEYEQLTYEEMLQQNWLAYNIGFKRGILQQKLRENQEK